MSSSTDSPTTGNKQTTTFRLDSIALPSKSSDHQSPQSSPGSSSSPSPTPRPSTKRTTTGLSGRHSFFRGIRLRNGKWVSEIREPRKTTRIWLGTYPVPEMAAAAYDVAALALKGPDAVLNFPGLALTYVAPATNSAAEIRAAAARAAEMKQPDPVEKVMDPGQHGKEEEEKAMQLSSLEFMDEEDMLDMPNLLTEMAEGMLMSPPRMTNPTMDDDSPENHVGDSLWSYK
ncbi:Ethylene-responsive transcription factor ERF025 [Raphanus sativus]|uniref:Ethylene-responsive transcription factor ERF025 n=1 Tax=Raphanus sativus TaxID=3726 RepID=A0A6J0KY51_RAPSA|nr:ethylene-responsive transcription factor ERF025 [Raphanus sativus]KAJ4875781.1 Ethylene-responsive transcription factor ERF025 [Raphanus sativus]